MTPKQGNDSAVIIHGVGDVGPRDYPDKYSIDSFAELVLPTLSSADIRMAQCERLYSVRGEPQVVIGEDAHSRCSPDKADVFSECGFDVVSLASNHSLDYGPEVL